MSHTALRQACATAIRVRLHQRRRRPDVRETLHAQAAAASRAGRPVAVLASWLYVLERENPKGRSSTTDRLAALMVTRADWRSGRRSRPGRHEAASLLGVSERTLARQWRLLEGLRLIVPTAAGRHLNAAETALSGYVRARAEWTCTMPALSATDAQKHLQRAHELLAALADAVDNPQVVAAISTTRVTPSPVGECFNSGTYRKWFSRPCGREDAPTGLLITTKNQLRRTRYRQDPQARQLARQLQQRIFWLHAVPLPVLASAVVKYAAAGWTARDIQLAADETLARQRWSVPRQPHHPVSYLRRLLAEHELHKPPSQILQDEFNAQTARQELRRQEIRVQVELAALGRRSHGPALAKEAARKVGQRRHQRRLEAQRREDQARRELIQRQRSERGWNE